VRSRLFGRNRDTSFSDCLTPAASATRIVRRVGESPIAAELVGYLGGEFLNCEFLGLEGVASVGIRTVDAADPTTGATRIAVVVAPAAGWTGPLEGPIKTYVPSHLEYLERFACAVCGTDLRVGHVLAGDEETRFTCQRCASLSFGRDVDGAPTKSLSLELAVGHARRGKLEPGILVVSLTELLRTVVRPNLKPLRDQLRQWQLELLVSYGDEECAHYRRA
jgi:hypothetical protein